MRQFASEGLTWADGMRRFSESKMNPLEYVKLKNAITCPSEAGLPIRTFDGETLNPVPEEDYITPFLATIWLPKNRETFHKHQNARQTAADKYWPQIYRLLTHLDRKQWDLFDKQFQELQIRAADVSEVGKIKAAFDAVECWENLFAPDTDHAREFVHKRIVMARATSRTLVSDLVEFFKAKGKDESINRELFLIRDRWARYYKFLHLIYLRFYWDDSRNRIESFTIAEKRFEELKLFYVDCFETFCRISTIAAGIEGIIYKSALGVPLSKRVMSLDEFDDMANGNKRALLQQLRIADLFAPFIDSNLRNGIGHHAAHFDAASDSINYTVGKDKNVLNLQIKYTSFCDQVVALYRQLHVVSRYAHWLRKSVLGVSDA